MCIGVVADEQFRNTKYLNYHSTLQKSFAQYKILCISIASTQP